MATLIGNDLFLGQLIKDFNWGPSQPNGGDQHCMYIVGGYLGYQWADFHCGFEMTFLCEYDVNDIEAWRKRRQFQGRMNPDPLQNEINIDEVNENYVALNIHYGFSNETTNSFQVPKHSNNNADHQTSAASDTNSVIVTKKPYRNSVVISTVTSSPMTKQQKSNEVEEEHIDDDVDTKTSKHTSDNDWTVYNFLKSIVKLG